MNELERLLDYPLPPCWGTQRARQQAIKDGAMLMARIIHDNARPGPTQADAMRHVLCAARAASRAIAEE